MLRIDQDPTNVPCPNFAGAAYAAVRQVMPNNGQINNDQAIEQLTAAWNQTHMQEVDAWNQQVQADLAEQAELTSLAEEEDVRQQAEDEHQKEEEKRNKKRNSQR